MSQLSIQEGSDSNSPKKFFKLKEEEEEEEDEHWTKVQGKLPASPKPKGVPKILEDIEQALYPPGFSKEEYA